MIRSAKRRNVILAGGLATATAAAGMLWVRAGNGGVPLTIDAALRKIDALTDALGKGKLASSGIWNPHQVFTHCAQSIEYSMSGYPAAKPKLFQDTIGAAAFSVFAAKGKMTHGLAEQIDGAPALEAKQDAGSALARLQQAFRAFRDHGGPLALHFAYGPLSKQQYEMAHVMHFYNHLDEISA